MQNNCLYVCLVLHDVGRQSRIEEVNLDFDLHPHQLFYTYQ